MSPRWRGVVVTALVLSANVANATRCPTTFAELGGSASGLGVSGPVTAVLCQRLELSPDGTPFVMWADKSTGTWETYLRQWDGSHWVGLGNSDADGGLSRGTGVSDGSNYKSCWGGLQFDSLKRPVAVWANYDGQRQAPYVQRWNGNAWEALANSATGDGIGQPNGFGWWPTLTTSSSDQHLVMWTQGTSLYARQWNGTQWVGLGGSETGTGITGPAARVTIHSAAGEPGGRTLVAWADARTSPREIRLVGWDGASWAGIGPSHSDGGLGTGDKPVVLFDGQGNPVVAWEAPGDGGLELHTARWAGGQWATFPSLAGEKPHLAADTQGRLFMAYELATNDGGSSIRLASFTGTEWETCSAHWPDTGKSSWPDVAIGPQGDVWVSWFEEVEAGKLRAYSVRGTQGSGQTTNPPRETDYAVGCACRLTEGSWLVMLTVLWGGRRRRS